MPINFIKRVQEQRGQLLSVDLLNILTFVPVRAFIVSGVPVNQERGGHSHKQTKQYLICVQGEIVVVLFDGNHSQSQTLTAGEFAFVDKMIWDRQKFLTDDAIMLVLCSTRYDASDYIRDFSEFMKLKSGK